MISAFIREFVIPLLLFLFLRSMVRSLFSSRRAAPRNAPPPQQAPVRVGGELHKDPVCGTYVSADSAVTLTVKGEMLYFCSRECWDKYQAR